MRVERTGEARRMEAPRPRIAHVLSRHGSSCEQPGSHRLNNSVYWQRDNGSDRGGGVASDRATTKMNDMVDATL